VRYLPDWAPGAGFKTTAGRYAAVLSECADRPYEFVKHQMAAKRHNPSFLSQCIDSSGDDAQLDFIHKYAAVSLYLGGADTVSVVVAIHSHRLTDI